MENKIDSNLKIAQLIFADIYPHYLSKIARKGRNKEELDTIIAWLTGYNMPTIQEMIAQRVDFKIFFENARIPSDALQIKGKICGIKIEEITNPLTKKIRILDKLVDELAKGKSINKITQAG